PLGHPKNGTVRVNSQSRNFFKSHTNAHLDSFADDPSSAMNASCHFRLAA
ncbi:hypothetical protein NEUTE2DRAFT_121225, partial [Neurospora tetrasperma FGSC 2509]